MSAMQIKTTCGIWMLIQMAILGFNGSFSIVRLNSLQINEINLNDIREQFHGIQPINSDQVPGYSQDQLESFVNKIVACDTSYGHGCNVNDNQLKGLDCKSNGSSEPSIFIFEINVGKRQI